MDSKICKVCGAMLPLSQFHKHAGNKDGLQNACKECRKVQSRGQINGGITQQGIKATFKISDFDDNMLFAELRRRGYAGELHYNRVVSI